jgi:hypothetical protein
VLRTETAVEDAAEQRGAGERLDRRLEALDGGPAGLKTPEDHRDAKRDPDCSEDITTDGQPDDPGNDEDGTDDVQDSHRSLSHDGGTLSAGPE